MGGGGYAVACHQEKPLFACVTVPVDLLDEQASYGCDHEVGGHKERWSCFGKPSVLLHVWMKITLECAASCLRRPRKSATVNFRRAGGYARYGRWQEEFMLCAETWMYWRGLGYDSDGRNDL